MDRIVQDVVTQLISFAIMAAVAWIAVKVFLWWRLRPLKEPRGLAEFTQAHMAATAARAAAAAMQAAPATFSGVNRDAAYQAPEVMAASLEHERDVRWVRLGRLMDDHRAKTCGAEVDASNAVYVEVSDAYDRSIAAKSLDELRALDMKALGIPCVRCGRMAEDHGEFPLCNRSIDVEGNPLPFKPTTVTGQGLA